MDLQPLPIQLVFETPYYVIVGIFVLFLIIWGIHSMIMVSKEHKLREKEYKLREQELLARDNDPTGFTTAGDTKKMPTTRLFRKGSMKYE